MSESLSRLFYQLGPPKKIRRSKSKAVFYVVGVFGGTNAYCKSISPLKETQFIYEATFPKLGAGYIQISVFRATGGDHPEVHMAGFGISVALDGARDRAIELMLDLARSSDMPVPDNFRELLEQHLQPSEVESP